MSDGASTAGGLLIGFAICIVLHHVAHARVAMMLGDKSPRLTGRASLSIKRHIDPLGSLVLPGVWIFVGLFAPQFIGGSVPPFAWGKAQTLNPRAMKNQKAAPIMAILAGPAATLIVCIVAGLAWKSIGVGSAPGTLLGFQPGVAARILGGITIVAAFLTAMELLPLPGRDGGRLLARFLSHNAAVKMEELSQYEALFLLVFFLFPPLTGAMIGFGDVFCKIGTTVPCGLLSI